VPRIDVTRATVKCVTKPEQTPTEWTVLAVRLPAEPSRHRVAVWRELRRAGALSLGQGVWALPATPAFEQGLDRAVARAIELVERADGDVLICDAVPRGDAMIAELEARYTDEREAEWVEFLAECAKFEHEIAKEIRIKKFTAAELDEEEQNLDRLRRWFRELRTRDLFGAPSQPDAEHRLKECSERLDDYAQQVFEHGAST